MFARWREMVSQSGQFAGTEGPQASSHRQFFLLPAGFHLGLCREV